MPAQLNAGEFLKRLKALRSSAVAKSHSHLAADENDKILGVRMGQVFALAKEFMNMELGEVEKMLESPIHEMRVGAVSIMDFQARSKKTTDSRRKELFDLYIRRHDRINTWDLVDRSAPWVVGSYLIDKPRKILYKLAKSKKMAERRTAIVSTLFFIGKGDVEDAFKLAELMLFDKEDLIHKANGWALRFAGDKDRKQLLKFLDKYADDMPRVTLRYATEKFDKKQREYYLKLKDQKYRMKNNQYLVLLRGINVGGKNIIKMADLKASFEAMGFSNVVTYIQSGNVVLQSEEKDKTVLTAKIEKGLSKRFNFEAKVVVISQKELTGIIKSAPEGFGKEEKKFRYDVIFLKEPLTPKEAMRSVKVREGVDAAHAGKQALYFSRHISRASQSYLTKIIGMPVYQNMTIRNWNTTTKLLALMEGQNG